MALQVVVSFGNIDANQLWTPTFMQELFQNASYQVVGTVAGSTILTAGSVLNTHLGDDSVDARVLKDTENAFVCAGLTINGPLAVAGGTGNVTVAGLLTITGYTSMNGGVALGDNTGDSITLAGTPIAWWTGLTAAVAILPTYTLAIDQGSGGLKKATVTQLQSAVRPALVIAEDQTGGQVPTVAAWNNRNITHLSTNEVAGASLAANVITLPAGRYQVRVVAAHCDCSGHVLRVATVSGTTLVMGVSTGGGATSSVSAPGQALLEGTFTLSGADQIRIQHFVAAGLGGRTFGINHGGAGGTQVTMRATFEFFNA